MTQKIPIDLIELYTCTNKLIDITFNILSIWLKNIKVCKSKKRALRKIINHLPILKNKKTFSDILGASLCISMSMMQIQLIMSQPDKPSKYENGGIICKPSAGNEICDIIKNDKNIIIKIKGGDR